MRTRAQASRDAALRRMTRVNHSLAAAAVVAVGVLTDVVAHIPYGHTRSVPAAPVQTTTRPGHSVTNRVSTSAPPPTSSAQVTASAPPASSSAPPPAASAPPVTVSAPPVVVSGGS